MKKNILSEDERALIGLVGYIIALSNDDDIVFTLNFLNDQES